MAKNVAAMAMDTPSFKLGLSQSIAADLNIVTRPAEDHPTKPQNAVLEAHVQSLPLSNISNASSSLNVETRKKDKYKQLDKENMTVAVVEKKSTARKHMEYSTRYYEWRAEFGPALGITCNKRIEDFNMQEIVDFSRHLVFFMQQIQKSNGEPYTPNTMKDYLHTFGRILKKGRDERTRTTGQYEPEIKVTTDALFKAARDACDKVISDNARVSGVSYKDEFLLDDSMIQKILESEFLSTSHPNGLLCRVEFYCITCFFIRPGNELWETLCVDFSFKKDVHGTFIRFCQQPPKNRPLNMQNCKPSDRRRPVEVYTHINPDLYETFRLYFSHMPPPEDEEGFMERHLLLSAITKPRTSVWFQIQNLGRHKISDLAKTVSSILEARNTLRASSSAEAKVVGGSSTTSIPGPSNIQVPEPSNINSASNIIPVAPSSPAVNFAPGAASISA